MAPANTRLLVVVEARAEISASARSIFEIDVDPCILNRVPRYAEDPDVAPDLPLLEAGEPRERENHIARIAPDIAISAAQRNLPRQIEKDVHLRLAGIRDQRGIQQRCNRKRGRRSS